MNKINYINKDKLLKIFAVGAIVFSSTMLGGCSIIEGNQKEAVVRDSFENVEIYNQNGEESVLSDLYYVKDRESDEVYICKKIYVDSKFETELSISINKFGIDSFTKYFGINGKFGLPIGDSGLLLTTSTAKYYAYNDIDTNEIITFSKNSNRITEDHKYEVSSLLRVIAEQVSDEMPSEYNKEQVKAEMQQYPTSYTIDELRDMFNIDNQKEY